QTLEQRFKISPAGPLFGARDRFCREQRALERVRGRDIGLRRALSHSDSETGASNIDAALANEFALAGQRINHGPRNDCHIERCAFFDPTLEGIGGWLIDREPCSVRALEPGHKLTQHLLHRVRAKHFNISHLAWFHETSNLYYSVPYLRTDCPYRRASCALS